MSDKLMAEVSITINAPANKVWQALTDTEMIKQYLFGTKATSDWKKGSSITYEGEWQGTKYKDKGTVIEAIPNKLLHTTYWSSMSGKEDKPENYNNVIYQLQQVDGRTLLTITQDNNQSEKELKHSQENWRVVLDTLKKIVEDNV